MSIRTSYCYFTSVKTSLLMHLNSATYLYIKHISAFPLFYGAAVLMLFPFAVQTLFFVQLTSIETRKVLEHIINYVIYKVLSLLYFQCPSAKHPKKKKSCTELAEGFLLLLAILPLMNLF